jgi:methylmalonyl-CoA/ethylmalonyl-CoA epimerase
MKKSPATVLTLALLALIGGPGMSTPPAVAQDSVGFEISPHHIGISVPNLEESIAWYRKMLGFEVVQRMNGVDDSAMKVALLRRGNCYIEFFQSPGAKPLPDYRRDPSEDLKVHGIKHMAFEVSDAKAAAAELEAKGAEISMGPIDSTGVVFVFIRDNAGNNFELIQFKQR